MADFKTCSSCPVPGKCRALGKCFKQKKDPKKMGRSNKKNPKHPMNSERTGRSSVTKDY